MTQYELTPSRYYYDDEINKVIVVFEQAAPMGHPDPAGYRPEQSFTIELHPHTVENEIAPPVPPEGPSPTANQSPTEPPATPAEEVPGATSDPALP